MSFVVAADTTLVCGMGWAGWWRAEEGEGLMELINLAFHDPIVRMTTVHFSCRAVLLGRPEPSAVG